MNEELKKRHFESILDEDVRCLYVSLCSACTGREGGMTDADQVLVADVARAEQIKKLLIEDIQKRGIGREYTNGRQRYYQENKSLAALRAQCEAQRKHLAELRLTPNSRKAQQAAIEDEFAEF